MIPTAEVASVPVTVKGGRIALDATRPPHVQGDITVAMPLAAALELLDPRTKPRMVLTCGTRVFDVGIRRRPVQQQGAEIVLSVASDEALLDDVSPLAADDHTPRTLESSLRSIVDYVLGVAIPGASLEPSPAVDADMTRYWALTNLLSNPSVVGSTAGYFSGSSATTIAYNAGAGFSGNGFLRASQTSNTGAVYLAPTGTGGFSVTPGRAYTVASYVRVSTATSPMRVVLRWQDENGAAIADVSPATVNVGTGWTRIRHTAIAPAGAVKCTPFIANSSTASGRTWDIDASIAVQDDELPPYFDGSTANTATYTYSWAGGANASASVRTPVLDRPRESLTWKVEQSGLEFLMPLVQSAGYRLVCDEQRRFTLRDETFVADGAIAITYGVNLIEGTDEIDIDGGLWFDAAVRRYRWRDRDGLEQERVDKFTLNDPPLRVDRRVINAAYPGPGRAEYAVRRAQNRGREVTASARANWAAAAEQPTTIILSGAPTQIGSAQRVEFDLELDEMTVSTMTADIPEEAWLLQNPDQPWTVNAPDITWLAAAT